MSTRGAFSFIYKNEIKVIRSFYSSDIKYLGKEIVDFLQNTNIKNLKSKIFKLKPMESENSYLNEIKFWEDSVQVLKGIELGVIVNYIDSKEFIKDSLFCEYYYEIDLDKGLLTIFKKGDKILINKYEISKIPEQWMKDCLLIEQQIEKKITEEIIGEYNEKKTK